MSPKPTCDVCLETFHYSEVSELTVELDMNGHDAPDICMWCEAEIQNAPREAGARWIAPAFDDRAAWTQGTPPADDYADAYASREGGI